MGEIRQQTANGVKWTAIERFSIQGATFLIGLVVARLLTPADYGLVGITGIFFAISQSVIDSGFSNALIRKKDCGEADYSTAFYFNVVVGAVMTALMFLCAPLIAAFFKQPLLIDITRVMSFNLFLGSLTIVQYAKLTSEINFKTQAKINFASAILSSVSGLVLAFLHFGVWALVFQGLIASILRALLMWTVVKWRPHFIFSFDSLRDLWNFGSKILFAGMLHSLYTELTTIFIGKFYTPKALGNYSRGTGMASYPVNIFNGIMQRVTYPIFAKIQDEDEKLKDLYRRYISLTSLLVFFGCTLLCVLAKPFILFVLSDKWAGAIIFLQIFAFAIMFDLMCTLNLNLLYIKGLSGLVLRLEIIKKSISILILLISVPLGVVAICVSKVVYTQIAVYINTYYTGKLIGIPYLTQVKDSYPYLLKSLLACAPAYILTFICNIHILVLIFGFIASCVLYLLILSKTNDAMYKLYVKPEIRKSVTKFCSIWNVVKLRR